MSESTSVNGNRQPMATDPAERHAVMRLFYRGGRPTRLGRWENRIFGWVSGLGLPPSFQVAVEVRGRKSGRLRVSPLVMPTVDGHQYLVSMLGGQSEWIKNVEASGGNIAIRHGRRREVHLVPVPVGDRAPILREYVRIASSGRQHFPVTVNAPLTDFAAIADRYPVYRVESAAAVR